MTLKEAYKNTQKYKRYGFCCEGYVLHKNERIAFTVEDVSAMGLKVFLQDQIEMNRNYALQISVASGKNIEIIARPVWDNYENRAGFEVLNNDPQWEHFIKLVQKGYFQSKKAA